MYIFLDYIATNAYGYRKVEAILKSSSLALKYVVGK